MTTDATTPIEIAEDWEEDLDELVAAEEFLQFFQIPYEASVVHVNRLHILQRFHDYLHKAGDSMPEESAARWAVHQRLLQRAYQDFVESDALTEKVFQVFHTPGGCHSFVSIDSLEVKKNNFVSVDSLEIKTK
ncbi:nitrogenase-stabilizing/protective protein NifW [Blastopirellula sp. JC732]|uniref:Nitrogenase-stabilizing/protective protein NifW n=1 Tax=Blastopirellula sediminis TaxID=2894196 RepID=A0A9X1MMV9_9BACT|nr:nitrogenase-stabilizing/protective protein NifW [Blastopirellula sediminis]MCC9608401.1 nitrogenase-stabilizing/protective protein NifW [Blastopirellula sediminis]MCC9628822.1 nitrogenase-stabilizing/protective protein NifW [Blastopirellula sediminis]